MLKTIFHRLLFTYAAIIVTVVVLLAVFLTVFFNVYFFEQKQRQLLAAGRRVEEQVRACQARKISQQELEEIAGALGAVTDSRIYVLFGPKIAELKYLTKEEGREDSGSGEILEDLKKILAGETLVKKKFFSSQLNIYVVFVGLPVYLDGAVGGAVLLFSPLEQINRTLFGVYKIIWLTAAASLVLAAAVIFLVSRRLSRPIENVQRAAAALAQGHFTGDLAPEGKDEIARLTETFNYMKNRLRQVEEMRRDLISNVSHELRTPLTSIRGFLQGILDGVIGPAEQERYLKLAYEEAGRLSRLVNDLLQLARLQAGSIKLQRESVSVRGLIAEIATEVRLAAEKKKILLRTEVSGGDFSVLADRDKLKQIILNLLDNALKYSPEGGEVEIAAGKEERRAIFRVRDSGPGIPEEEIKNLFQKFYRVEKSRSREIPGTGLGLSIARELVELHGGAIEIRSGAGRGTEAVFTLPIGEGAPAGGCRPEVDA